MCPMLDLTDAQEMSFEAIPPGKYFAYVHEAEERETSGKGKLPEGTPMIWLHFVITGKVGEDEGPNEDSEYYNRRAFTNLAIPPADYDEKARRVMNGNLVSFYKAVGYTQEEIQSGEFDVPTDDLFEKELIIVLNRKANDYKGGEMDNNVIGYKNPAEVDTAVTSSGGLL